MCLTWPVFLTRLDLESDVLLSVSMFSVCLRIPLNCQSNLRLRSVGVVDLNWALKFVMIFDV